jgi:pantoate--beta-alanine ligase
MQVIRTIADLRQFLAELRRDGPVGLVPTMGALHRGHTMLFDMARRECATVIASLFVNPTQFNDARDLAAYPRTEAEDRALAEAHGIDVLFSPSAGEMYRPEHATVVSVAGPALGHEGAHRPGHFDGVATVCVKLFAMVLPDRAYFGQKDAQQVAVIRQVIGDLNLPVGLRVAATVRDDDGLALSSRNVRLSVDERRRALVIPQALTAGLQAYRRGDDPAAAAEQLLRSAGLAIDYAAVADLHGEPTLLVAVHLGVTRLIDNVPLRDPGAAGLAE